MLFEIWIVDASICATSPTSFLLLGLVALFVCCMRAS